MNDPKLKFYAVTAVVKPLPTGNVRYQSKMYRGLAYAKNPNDAKEATIQILLKSFIDVQEPKVTREVIIIKDCKLHHDFYISAE
jgi:hypothetical protein